MTDVKNHSACTETGSPEGRVFRPSSTGELSEAVELAFDYRGDVTLQLKSGESLTGYVFNRDVSGSMPYLELFPQGRSDIRKVLYAEVLSIAFTGEDTASGKSWESWIAKKESERRAEAARVEADAKSRGHL